MGSPLATLPEWEMKYFCRWVYRATEEYFKDPEVQKRFEAWQKEKAEKKRLQEQSELCSERV